MKKMSLIYTLYFEVKVYLMNYISHFAVISYTHRHLPVGCSEKSSIELYRITFIKTPVKETFLNKEESPKLLV